MSFCQRSSSWLNDANNDSLTLITIWGRIRLRATNVQVQIWTSMFEFCILRWFEKHKLMWPFIYASGRNNALFVTQLMFCIENVILYLVGHLNFLHSITYYYTQAIYKLLKTIRMNRYEKSTVVPIHTFWDSTKKINDLWLVASAMNHYQCS